MKYIFIIAFILLNTANSYSQEIKWENPVIEKYGKIVALPDVPEQPDKNIEYKILINIIEDERTMQGINKSLDLAARTVNLFASAGIPPEKLKIVVIIQRKATHIVKKGEKNDSEVIHALKKAGVKIFVCGQALSGYNIPFDEVNNDVTIALSAITVLTTYQLKGYSLIPN
jgi:intracellular sulfur oxidation DsrE/DsrF family protein